MCSRRFISLTISINPVPETVKPFTVNQHGYSLNAAVACTADRRDRLERLCRYVTRPAIALERLSCLTPDDCELACVNMECGTDKNIVCGTCGDGLSCTADGQCLTP